MDTFALRRIIGPFISWTWRDRLGNCRDSGWEHAIWRLAGGMSGSIRVRPVSATIPNKTYRFFGHWTETRGCDKAENIRKPRGRAKTSWTLRAMRQEYVSPYPISRALPFSPRLQERVTIAETPLLLKTDAIPQVSPGGLSPSAEGAGVYAVKSRSDLGKQVLGIGRRARLIGLPARRSISIANVL